jgi:hypothetical protein
MTLHNINDNRLQGGCRLSGTRPYQVCLMIACLLVNYFVTNSLNLFPISKLNLLVLNRGNHVR